MKNILFFAPYPTEDTIQDGYTQRIKNIDNLFIDCNRTYLEISYRLKNKDNVIRKENIIIYQLNIFRNLFKIINIIKKHKYIYIHSIYRFFPLCLFFSKRQKVTLDFHGIIPEEKDFSGDKKGAKFYSKIEKKAINRVNNIVVVTHSMEKYIKTKYPEYKNDFIYFPIISKNVLKSEIKGEIKKNPDEIVFVYSGNCQKWQRIMDVMDFINKHGESNYTYYLLTLEVDKMTALVNDNITKNVRSKIIIKTVKPENLCEYYEIADYGFLIRDNSPVNIVANPTKMMEYMFYNLKLIVDFTDIGDYKNYDYIKYNTNEIIVPGKSLINKKIALDIMNQKTDSLKDIVLKE